MINKTRISVVIIRSYAVKVEYAMALVVLIVVFTAFVCILMIVRCKTDNSSKKHYRSRCWNCGAEIDSKKCVRCPVCKYYICEHCGKCLCEYIKRNDILNIIDSLDMFFSPIHVKSLSFLNYNLF